MEQRRQFLSAIFGRMLKHLGQEPRSPWTPGCKTKNLTTRIRTASAPVKKNAIQEPGKVRHVKVVRRSRADRVPSEDIAKLVERLLKMRCLLLHLKSVSEHRTEWH